jgi:TPP-dependent trihydroxycyclohexane-1,2-dione (THcHDO) dehydratase
MSGVLPGVSFIRNMPQALGLKKAYPNRQVISLSGDGGLAMLRGDSGMRSPLVIGSPLFEG